MALYLFPQNAWTSPDAPLRWGVYRNIPFALLGAVIVVLFADAVPAVGMLMIPKTCAYVWTVRIGFQAMRKEK